MKKIRIVSFITGLVLLLFLNLAAQPLQGDEAKLYKTESDIFYYPNDAGQVDEYMQQQCRLDLYYPQEKANFATVIWFHAGGLKAGNRFIPEQLKRQGIAIAAVDYRLYPKVSSPAYIEDAAAAVAWVFKNIQKFGGDSSLIFVSGHSAGGYLTSMIGMDKRWLAAYEIDADRIAGLIPFSGHTITHFTVREERGIPGEQPIIDELAPLFYVRADAPPLVLITGDRDLELLGRYEENAYMMRMMKVAGHQNTTLYELQGFDHGGMAAPAFSILLNHIRDIEKIKQHKQPEIMAK